MKLLITLITLLFSLNSFALPFFGKSVKGEMKSARKERE